MHTALLPLAASPAYPGVLSRLDALDLGCGTGLMGLLLRPYCRGALVGCDLSKRMLSVGAASHPGVYDRLHAAEGVSFLNGRPPASADLIVAADVFPYLGSLSDMAAAAQAALCVGGVFCFSTEACRLDECGVQAPGGGGGGAASAAAHAESYTQRVSSGWVQRVDEDGEATERIAHSAEYLCSLAVLASSELDLGAISSVVLRRDGTQTIKGFAVLMIKRAPVAPNG